MTTTDNDGSCEGVTVLKKKCRMCDTCLNYFFKKSPCPFSIRKKQYSPGSCEKKEREPCMPGGWPVPEREGAGVGLTQNIRSNTGI